MEKSILIQKTRKENLKKIIKDKFGDKIDVFAKHIGKNKHVVYAMLWDVDNSNNRKISDATARAIEQKLSIELFSLDQEQCIVEIDPNMVIIPFMDNKLSNDLGDVYIHTYERIKLPKNMFENIANISDLLAFKISNMDMFPSYSIGDIVIINRLKQSIEDNHQYLVKQDGKFLIRTFTTKNNKIYISYFKETLELEANDSGFEIFGIVDLEIRKKLYVS